MKKKVFTIALLAIGLFAAKQSHAQYSVSGSAPSNVDKDAKATKVIAVNKKTVADKTCKGKYGPDGQIIFIDKDSHYYYLDPKGLKVYCTKDQLKSKKVKKSN